MSLHLFQEQCFGFLNTPPLWKNTAFGIRQFDFPEIDLSDFVAEPIPMNIRLGHQMEYVFNQLIAHSRQYEVVLHNLPIKKENRTIGEIDFILRELRTEKLIHVELTYKFYIIDPGISEPIHRLMGPNKRDLFFTKMEKIKNRQFKVLHSEEAAKALYDRNIDPTGISQEACFKAQLFVPFGSAATRIRPLNHTCIGGHWIRFDDFNTPEFQSYRFYIPFKTEWVIAPHSAVNWTSHHETLLEIKLRIRTKNAPMLWIKKSETEFEKFFVVWW
ncbi:MAG: DUF1853 family protein [Flavobacteriaceae bacterium]